MAPGLRTFTISPGVMTEHIPIAVWSQRATHCMGQLKVRPFTDLETCSALTPTAAVLQTFILLADGTMAAVHSVVCFCPETRFTEQPLVAAIPVLVQGRC